MAVEHPLPPPHQPAPAALQRAPRRTRFAAGLSGVGRDRRPDDSPGGRGRGGRPEAGQSPGSGVGPACRGCRANASGASRRAGREEPASGRGPPVAGARRPDPTHAHRLGTRRVTQAEDRSRSPSRETRERNGPPRSFDGADSRTVTGRKPCQGSTSPGCVPRSRWSKCWINSASSRSLAWGTNFTDHAPSTARRGRGVGHSRSTCATGDTTVTNATATATRWNCGPRSTICPFTRPRWTFVGHLDTTSRGRLAAEPTGTEEKRHRYPGRPSIRPRPIDYLDRRCIDYLDHSQWLSASR